MKALLGVPCVLSGQQEALLLEQSARSRRQEALRLGQHMVSE